MSSTTIVFIHDLSVIKFLTSCDTNIFVLKSTLSYFVQIQTYGFVANRTNYLVTRINDHIIWRFSIQHSPESIFIFTVPFPVSLPSDWLYSKGKLENWNYIKYTQADCDLNLRNYNQNHLTIFQSTFLEMYLYIHYPHLGPIGCIQNEKSSTKIILSTLRWDMN